MATKTALRRVKDDSPLVRFLIGFVEPLFGGGKLEISAPYSSRTRERMLSDASGLLRPELEWLRLERARELVADPSLSEIDGGDLSLWLALYNLLALDHPDTGRVWAREATWRGVADETRTLLAFSRADSPEELLSRHVAVEAFLALERADYLVVGEEGELRYPGYQRERGRARLTVAPEGGRFETVKWRTQPHRPAVESLLEAVFSVSPLTALLRPELAPADWSPLSVATFFQRRDIARAICYRWAKERQWLRIGGVVTGSLLRTLSPEIQASEPSEHPALPGESVDLSPDSIANVVGALVHLQVLKVMEFDARINVGGDTRETHIQSFLALPLLLPALEEKLGIPDVARGAWDGGENRWEEYLEYLRSLVPRSTVENLLATLVTRIVERENR